MPLTWNEIKTRAAVFVHEWRDQGREQAVLDARQPHLDAGATLADLYDPLAMPAPLVRAHQALDRAVDRAYRPQAFTTEANRVAFLFDRYEALANPLSVA